MAEGSGAAAEKAALRTMYAARRAARSDADHHATAQLLASRARELPSCGPSVVAAFVPTRGEPGSLAVLDVLATHARVLLPVTTAPDQPLRWAAYAGAGSLVAGPYGLRQPAASDGSSLADAGLVLVPAVAAGLDGTRLGHGGGFYDRALHGIARDKLAVVVHDDEVATTLPVEPHDLAMGWLCTPRRWLRLPSA